MFDNSNNPNNSNNPDLDARAAAQEPSDLLPKMPEASKPMVSISQTEAMKIVVAEALQSGLDSQEIVNAIGQLYQLPIILGQAIKARAYDLGLTSEREKWVNLGGVSRGKMLVEVVPDHNFVVQEGVSVNVKDLSTIHHTSEIQANEPHMGSINCIMQKNESDPVTGFRVSYPKDGPTIKILRGDQLFDLDVDDGVTVEAKMWYLNVLRVAKKYLEFPDDKIRQMLVPQSSDDVGS